MIVLVNEHSASASEIVAGSLMDNHRAVVIGQRTYGKGSVQEVIPLESNGGELKLTVAYYYLPSGKCVHRKKDSTDWGVTPQIIVPMDPAAENKMLRDRYEQELFKRPVVKSTTQSTTQPTTQPAQALDVQLQRAVDTMIALVVLSGNQPSGPQTLVPPIAQKVTTTTPVSSSNPSPATVPTTAPVSAPSSTGP
jgi:hypothetical protein